MPDRLIAALAGLSDADLERLRQLSDDAVGPTAGLLAALAHVADHELYRRSGINFERLPLTPAIDPANLDACLVLAARLADRLGDVPGIRALIAAVVAEVTVGERKH